METYRLFIAAELPAEVKAELAAVQSRLRPENLPVRWVAPTAMHLTLRFLGETDAGLLPDVARAMGAALAARRAVALHLAAVGAFPGPQRPSVIWAGIGGATAELARAVADLEDALVELGLPREPKPFRAHLTLGRVRRDAARDQLDRAGAAVRGLPPPRPVAWMMDRIVLFRSELRREGPVYTSLDEVMLSQR